MTVIKKLAASALLAGFAMAGCQTSVVGYDDSGVKSESHEVFDLSKMSCWELSTLEQEDAAFASVLAYGYKKGLEADPLMTGSKIESTLGDIATKCAGNPDMMVMDVF